MMALAVPKVPLIRNEAIFRSCGTVQLAYSIYFNESTVIQCNTVLEMDDLSSTLLLHTLFQNNFDQNYGKGNGFNGIISKEVSILV